MNIKSRLSPIIPGLSISIVIGFAAGFLSEHYGAPAMLFALLLGMSLNFIADDQRTIPGIAFSGRTLLRIGVALLGFRIVLGDILALGARPIFLLFLAVLTTLLFGFLIARLAGLSKHFGALSGGAVGICGASAALAIA
ncbi:MAG: putative sulfate exporter family transporter, partial [Gammaproteobacteria bacterium]|nr:putative sulfate exporter family transporter [Gammaproteobacteria bacterium]